MRAAAAEIAGWLAWVVVPATVGLQAAVVQPATDRKTVLDGNAAIPGAIDLRVEKAFALPAAFPAFAAVLDGSVLAEATSLTNFGMDGTLSLYDSSGNWQTWDGQEEVAGDDRLYGDGPTIRPWWTTDAADTPSMPRSLIPCGPWWSSNTTTTAESHTGVSASRLGTESGPGELTAEARRLTPLIVI